jgi:hydroxyethylthiazole kinase
VYAVKNGHQLMAHVVGTGCMATSVIAAFAAVERNLAAAAAAGLACYEIAAEIAAVNAKGPGSFKEQLFDAAFNLDAKTADSRQKISVVGK